MAEFVSTNQYLLVNSVDLSSVLLGTDMAEVIESQDITAMGASARIALPGLIGHSFRAEFNQNYAASGAGSVDATISALVSRPHDLRGRVAAGQHDHRHHEPRVPVLGLREFLHPRFWSGW